MKASPELSRLLDRVLDGLPDREQRLYRFNTKQGELTEIEISPFSLCRVFNQNETFDAPQVQSVARIQGRIGRKPVLALLQVYRSTQDYRDITSIEWHIDSEQAIWNSLFRSALLQTLRFWALRPFSSTSSRIAILRAVSRDPALNLLEVLVQRCDGHSITINSKNLFQGHGLVLGAFAIDRR